MGRTKQVSDEAVLEAAKAVFVEQGFGASTREVARRAGISEAVLYQRYKTKVGLFFAAMVPPPIELAAATRAGRPSVTDDLHDLAASIMGYFRDAMPVLLQVMTHPSFNLADLADRKSRLPLQSLGEAIAACLERHRNRGAITSNAARVQAATLTLLSTLHSLALFERMGAHGGLFPEAVVQDIVGLVVDGLAPEREVSP
jgi:AcrR family transcriptional regulator